FAPSQHATSPGARLRRRPDAENFGGEVSFLNLPCFFIRSPPRRGRAGGAGWGGGGPSGEQIGDEIGFGWLLDWDVGRLGPTQNLVDITSRAPEQVREVWSVGHQTARFDVLPKAVYRRQSGGQRQRVDANPVGEC